MIAKKFKCSQITVSALISKFKNHRTIDILPGRGPKKIITKITDRRIKYEIVRSGNVTTKQITTVLKDLNINVSRQLIRNRLNSHGLYGRIKRKVPMISKVNQKKRFLYAKEYRNHPNSYWDNVMYIDEKKFELICNPRKQYIWRRKNSAYDDGNTQAYTRSESVMVWGAFGANGVGDIVIIPITMNGAMYRDILKKYLGSSAKKIGLKRRWKLLQDNDPKNTSKIVKSEYLR